MGKCVVSACEDIPELSEENLNRWLATEADNEVLAKEIAATFKNYQDTDARFSGGKKPDVSGEPETTRLQHAQLLLKCAELLGVTLRLGKRGYR